jgi:hypothetical protein
MNKPYQKKKKTNGMALHSFQLTSYLHSRYNVIMSRVMNIHGTRSKRIHFYSICLDLFSIFSFFFFFCVCLPLVVVKNTGRRSSENTTWMWVLVFRSKRSAVVSFHCHRILLYLITGNYREMFKQQWPFSIPQIGGTIKRNDKNK